MNDHAYHTYDTYLNVYSNSYPFLVWVHCVTTSGGMVCCFLKDCLLFFPFFFSYLYPWFFLVFWTKVPFTSGNGLEPVGWDWCFFIKSSLFYSATRRHEISFEYLLKLHSRYCCCMIIFEAWKVENVSSSIVILWYFHHTILVVK